MASGDEENQPLSRRAFLRKATTAGVFVLGSTLTWRSKSLLGAALSKRQTKKENHFDVIVLGLGCVGASACLSLAGKGAKVLGIERFETVPHHYGESQGDAKVIRKAYFEGDVYVPLIRRSYDLWAEMESALKKKIFYECGVLTWGPRNPAAGEESILQQSEKVARRQGIEIQRFEGAAAKKLWPMYQRPDFPQSPYDAIFEPGAGYLDVDVAMKGYIELAKKRGAQLRFSEQVLAFSADEKKITVKTDKGTYSANQIIITGGAWTYDLMAKHLELPLTLAPRVQLWFPAKSDYTIDAKKVPVFFYDLPEPYGFVYGFPKVPGHKGIKVSGYIDGFEGIKSLENLDARKDYPQALNKAIETTRKFVQSYLPFCDASHGPFRIEPCNYTKAPGSHWILDKVPSHPRINLGCGFSGHGFKCSPSVGEVLADLALGNKVSPAYDMKFFSLESAKQRALR